MRWRIFLTATTLVIHGGWVRADMAFSSDGNGVDLVRNGQPTSVIVVPSSRCRLFAAEELQHHVKASTGATLPIREEGDATVNSRGVVFLGGCQAADGAVPGGALSPNAHHIQLPRGICICLATTGMDRFWTAAASKDRSTTTR